MSACSFPALRRAAFLGNHPPWLCGLATFTVDLRSAIAGAVPEADCFALAITDNAGGPYDYPPAASLAAHGTWRGADAARADTTAAAGAAGRA